jgi:hypothetical protein
MRWSLPSLHEYGIYNLQRHGKRDGAAYTGEAQMETMEKPRVKYADFMAKELGQWQAGTVAWLLERYTLYARPGRRPP